MDKEKQDYWTSTVKAECRRVFFYIPPKFTVIPPSETTQWRSHKACAEPVEVKTVEQYSPLVEQVNLFLARTPTIAGILP